MQLTITLIIVIITVLVSLGGFTNPKINDDLIFHPPSVARGQWYRFITHGLLHGDAFHLIFNMIALWSFGQSLEQVFSLPCVFGSAGKWIYLLIYVTALVVASLPDLFKHRNDYGFRSLGASGAISAVIFASVILRPGMGIGLIGIPGISVPAWLFAFIYLGISAYLDRKGGSHVNHGAHFWGAIYGLIITFLLLSSFAHIDVIQNIKAQLDNSDQYLFECGDYLTQ